VLLGTVAITVIALALPLSPLAPVLGMTSLPSTYLLLLALVLVLYCVLVGAAKAGWHKVDSRRPPNPADGRA
jgi:Mg2+-importing ATPase